jgi:hypothetical protein
MGKKIDSVAYVIGCIFTLGGLWMLRVAITRALISAENTRR